MTACVKCNTENNSTAKFCKSCGTSLNPSTSAVNPVAQQTHCPACSSLVPAGARFCKKCGVALPGLATPCSPGSGAHAAAPEEPVDPTSSLPVRPQAVSPPETDGTAQAAHEDQLGTGASNPPPVEQAAVAEPAVAQAAAMKTAAASSHMAVTILVITLAAGLFGGGIYWWSKTGQRSGTVPEQAVAPVSAPARSVVTQASVNSAAVGQPVSVSRAATGSVNQVVSPAPIAFTEPAHPVQVAVAPLRAASLEPVPAAPPARRVILPTKAKPKAVPAASHQDALLGKVAALLAKSDDYIARQQYDKAVATGESVLILDPGNASAKTLIRRAKAKQLEALKAGTSLE